MCGKIDRWELAAPFDALSWALCLKNRRAARALLEKREALTWIEGSEYAPLTLGWAPELLNMILDRVPEGELFCAHCFPHPRGSRDLLVESSLLTAAAALDDLTSVELLLARGNCELDEQELYRNIHDSSHYHELQRIQSNLSVKRTYDMLLHLCLGLESTRNLREGIIVLQNYVALGDAGPLSSAIFCGAKRCALRLLEAGAEITLPVRHALTETRLLEDKRYHAAVDAVVSAIGVELPDLLAPTDFTRFWDGREHPLFHECLKRHAMELNSNQIRYVFTRAQWEEWAREVLCRIDPIRLSGWLLKQSDPQTTELPWTMRIQEAQWLFSVRGLELILDRNNVPSRADMDILLRCLDHAKVTGDVPEEKLSGLAIKLLNDIMDGSYQTRTADSGSAPVSATYRSILREENPRLIWRYLNGNGHGKGPAFLIVLSLLRGSRL